jgi:PAS domain S-box-containing protein
MRLPLHVLMVEDSEDDAQLLVRELTRGGYDVTSLRVETAEALTDALLRESWQVILCDFALPHFNGTAALRIVKDRSIDLPFIFVSGTMGEDVAVAAMKAGAHDYVMKNNLVRLAPSVERELRDAEDRKLRRQAEANLRISEHKYRHIFRSMSDAALLVREEADKIVDANDQAEALLGRTREEILGMNSALLSSRPEEGQPPAPAVACPWDLVPGGYESDVLRKDGAAVPVHVCASRVRLKDRSLLLVLFRDITERKRADEERRTHLSFFESMDRINRAVQGTNDLEQTMGEALNSVLSVFDCDRAFLMPSCDPEAPSWNIPMERTRPEYPGSLASGVPKPMDVQVAETLRILLTSDRPVTFGPGTEHPLPTEVSGEFGIKSVMSMALHPKVGKPWLFGIHQCSHPRIWTPAEETLLREIGRRLADALTSLLAYRDLRESAQEIQDLYDNAPCGYQSIDENGVYLRINQTALSWLGRTREEVVGKMSFPDLMTPDGKRTFQETFPKFKSDGRVDNLEFDLVRKDGTIIQVLVSATAIQDTQGKFLMSRSVLHDITDRKRAEEEVRKLWRAVEQSPVSIVLTDTTGRIEYVNPRFTEVTGYSPAEALGQNPRLLKSGETPREQYETLWQTIVSGKEWRGEFHNRRKNGELFWETASISPIRNAQGVVTHYLGIKEDITAQKYAQERIREQAALLDQTQDAVLVLGLDRRFRYCNRTAMRTFGLDQARLPDQDAAILLFTKHPDRCAEVCQATLEHGAWSGETQYTTALGGSRVAFSRWTLICDDAGRPVSLLIVNTDVTEQKRMEEQFLRAQRMESIGTLASGVAHDLNNILSPIFLASGLLRPIATSEEDRETIDMLEKSARRGAEIVSQLLTFGRGADGERIPVQPRSLLKEMVTIIHETFPKNLTVEQQIPGNLWVVRANPTQIHQVLLNLCVNARDAMPGGGQLTIAAENLVVDAAYAAMNPEAKPGPYVVLRVGDTGTGIPPENIQKIFDPFFTTKGLGKGTGLGLSTVAGIVRSHGGFIQVSTRTCVGTEFRVYLPATAEKGDLQSTTPVELLPRGGGELVLVVDDEDSIRSVLQRTLEAAGYRVVTAADGAEALFAFSKTQEPFAAVITDMLMPVMDGAALILALRRHSPDLIIIAASGVAEQETVAIQAGLGAGAFLMKPFSTERLVMTLHKVFDDRVKSRKSTA